MQEKLLQIALAHAVRVVDGEVSHFCAHIKAKYTSLMPVSLLWKMRSMENAEWNCE